jgi:aminoglycoside N3'-acetyltransferase
MNRISKEELIISLASMGVKKGDTILVRAGLKEIGRLKADTFISALLDCVGESGTILSLAFTSCSHIKRPKKEDAFDIYKKSNAGSLPNAMLKYEGAVRSLHPTCSFVAIGKNAEMLTKNHDENSPAYEPMRGIMNLDGKCLLVGCVATSPGFTTTHLAEYDLGLLSRVIFPKLFSTYYKLPNGNLSLFRRKDVGLCSKSFYKFYALYIKNEMLTVGYVGKAYSIIASAKDSYNIDYSILKANPQFNICDSDGCTTCNGLRWDRVHKIPKYLFLRLIAKFCNS